MTGTTADEAAAAIEDAGLTAAYDDEEPTEPELCDVSDQEPVGGETVDEGTDVALTIECRVRVPDVELPAEDGETALQDATLTASFREEPSDPSVCTIAEQYPYADEEVEPESDVELALLCEVPDVTSQQLDEAESELESAGYTASHSAFVNDPSLCTVSYQDPDSEAEPGAEIELDADCFEEDY